MPGVLSSVEAEPGQPVDAGAALLALESMKMYQAVQAPAEGGVAALHCASGDAVEAGQALVRLGPLGEDADPDATR